MEPAIIAVFLFVLGAVVGSFLNVCIDRIPKGESIFFPPSHCDSCGRRLAPLDLVPALTYLWQRGKCRYCHADVHWRMPVVELATGILFAGIGHMVGWGLQLAPALFYASLFLVVLVTDLERQMIPNRLVLPALPLAWLLSVLWPLPEAARGVLVLLPAPLMSGGVTPVLVQSLAGGLIAFLVMLIPWLLFPGGLGAGDVKLAALVGLATGFPLALLALLISFLGGGVVGGALLLTGVKGRKEPIPFGPFLAIAAMVVFLWGDALARWYWHSLSF
ncbi:MAG: prepilin peptidase [Dehalococcoidia bacterium]|nr:prepilin peptidase [Dehalococcoidia bacterium]